MTSNLAAMLANRQTVLLSFTVKFPGFGGGNVGVGCTVDDGNTVCADVGVIDILPGGITVLLCGITVMCEGVTVMLCEGATVMCEGATVMLCEGATVLFEGVTVML